MGTANPRRLAVITGASSGIGPALQPGPTETNFFARANMEETPVGRAEKDDPADVARRGFEAMMAGKDSVLAGGMKSRLQGLANEVLPETMKAKASAKQAKPDQNH